MSPLPANDLPILVAQTGLPINVSLLARPHHGIQHACRDFTNGITGARGRPGTGNDAVTCSERGHSLGRQLESCWAMPKCMTMGKNTNIQIFKLRQCPRKCPTLPCFRLWLQLRHAPESLQSSPPPGLLPRHLAEGVANSSDLLLCGVVKISTATCW